MSVGPLPARAVESGHGLVLGDGVALRVAQGAHLGFADPHGAIDRHEEPPEPLARVGNGVGISSADRIELLRSGAAGDGLAGPALLLRDFAGEALIALVGGLRPGDAGRKGGKDEEQDVASHAASAAIDDGPGPRRQAGHGMDPLRHETDTAH